MSETKPLKKGERVVWHADGKTHEGSVITRAQRDPGIPGGTTAKNDFFYRVRDRQNGAVIMLNANQLTAKNTSFS